MAAVAALWIGTISRVIARSMGVDAWAGWSRAQAERAAWLGAMQRRLTQLEVAALGKMPGAGGGRGGGGSKPSPEKVRAATDVAALLAEATVDAPLLTTLAPLLASVAITLPAQLGTAVFDTTVARCDAEIMNTEAVPLRHPRERRLVVLSCGGVGSDDLMPFLAAAARPYGYTLNCAAADSAHFRHRFPDGASDAALLTQLYCYEPDRILYLLGDPWPATLATARAGGGCSIPPMQPPVINGTAPAAGLEALVASTEEQRADLTNRGLHVTGWAVANVPAPLLFLDASTLAASRSVLADFLGIPRTALAGMRSIGGGVSGSGGKDGGDEEAPAAVLPPATRGVSLLRQLHGNLYRQARLLHRHLVVPEGWRDRLRTPAVVLDDLSFLPRAQLQCPAAVPGGARDEVNAGAVEGMLAPSRALAPLDSLLEYCGEAWRTTLSEYAQFHAAARAQLLAAAAAHARAPHIPMSADLPRVVVWRCPVNNPLFGCGGMADRLVGMSSVFVFAVVFQRSPCCAGPPPSLPPLPAVPGLDWRFDSRLVAGRRAVDYNLFNCNTRLNAHPCLWNDAHPDVTIDADVAYVSTNRGFIGAVQPYAALRKLGLSAPIAALCIYHAAWRPAPYIMRRVAQVYEGAGIDLTAPSRPRLLGVHFRTGDDAISLHAGGTSEAARELVLARERGMQTAILDCLHTITGALAHAGHAYHIFLMGDNPAIRRAVATNFSNADVTIVADTPAHIEAAIYRGRNATAPAATAVDDALLEWLLLANSDTLLLTYSGYSRTAWAYGGNNYAVLAANNLQLDALPQPICRLVSLPTLALSAYAAGL